MNTDQPNRMLSDEWVMIGTNEPQNFYIGHVVVDQAELAHDELRNLLRNKLAQREPIHLVDARLLLTLVQFRQDGGTGMSTQLMPISGSAGRAELHIVANVIMFPSEVPGMGTRLDEMAALMDRQDMENRARSSGILMGGNSALSRKA